MIIDSYLTISKIPTSVWITHTWTEGKEHNLFLSVLLVSSNQSILDWSPGISKRHDPLLMTCMTSESLGNDVRHHFQVILTTFTSSEVGHDVRISWKWYLTSCSRPVTSVTSPCPWLPGNLKTWRILADNILINFKHGKGYGITSTLCVFANKV